MSDVVSLRLASQTEKSTTTQYRLLELPPDLCKLIESASSGVRLEIKGREGDDAVLCTENKTYALRSVNVSNSLHVTTGPEDSLGSGPGNSIFLNEGIHEIMEIVPTVPKLDRLRGILRGSEYGEEEWDNDMRNEESLDQEQRRYSRAELAQIIQASDVEFSNALKSSHILELDGIMRPLPLEQLSKILVYVFTSLISYGLPRKQIPASRLADILETEHEVPSAVTKQVMNWFGSVSDGIWDMDEIQSVRHVGLGLLRPHMHTPIGEDVLLTQWKTAVGDAFAHHVKLSLLRGEYLIQPNTVGRDQSPDVVYFSRSRLPIEPLQRFNELFLTRTRWKEVEMVAFLEDIAVDKKDCDRLLIKYARRSAEKDGTVYYTARAGYV
ncbi:hypothetical protein M408DRAFT_15130 [Serendipita vermifera MAFF 305830]|uniref:Sister chromatid cohesion protein DCC1 n=1 Tax=Serendipita vermifera MAFF 305830 TaxID=933852 RepID=A0A0C3BIK7_SERVB|nr:hypothetical protein M408DRAFT_15130 [Serendipita vermifera MAFF 305830]